MAGRLEGKRILVTDAAHFMGPPFCEAFAAEGAEVIADESDPSAPGAADEMVRRAGRVDALVANLAAVNPRKPAVETGDAEWAEMYDVMVHPLHRLTRAVLPQMIERRSGKILVMGSAATLRVQPNWSSYASARGAQLAYMRAVAVEVAPHNVQINAIAQTFVENPVYFSPEYIASADLQERLKQVPLGRLAKPEEDAKLAIYLVSDESDFVVGQVIGFNGGWHV